MPGKAGIPFCLTEQCIVYKSPSISDPTDKYLEKMTIVAVSQKDPRTGWWKVRWVKKTEELHEWWVKAKNLTFAEIDLGAIKLYNLAKNTDKQETKQSLMNTLLSDYKNSVFIEEIQKAHQEMISESMDTDENKQKSDSESENTEESTESAE